MPKPLVVVVADGERVLPHFVADLDRRFGADYHIVGAVSAEAGLAVLAPAAERGDPIALVIAEDALLGPRAIDLLTSVHELAPTAKRVLLIPRGNWTSANPVISAMALGQVDYHLWNPWRPLERILYPAISEFLAAWDSSQDTPAPALRIVGDEWSASSHVIRDTLTRIGVPYWFYDAASEPGRALLDEACADGSRLPVLVFFTGVVLVQPDAAELWEVLGLRTRPEVSAYDVAVVGAGPAGLAAAVYAASEGLRTLVLERAVPGGQAGTSSLIRNYLGFQRGVSGEELTMRALEQAWLFGSSFVVSQTATALHARGAERVLTTHDGSQVTARAVIIASGVAWRRLGEPGLERLVGAGVFYGAASAEARAMQGLDVFVLGAGNSAGQAALHLARYAASVTMLVRGDSLGTSMSAYLVREIEEAPNIGVRLHTEVVDGQGRGRLERLTVRRRDTGHTEVVPASAVFVLIGAEPGTEWLHGSLERDERGYILTGRDLGASWPLERPPLRLETSMPGVFAAGDVRHRSVKRVAAAVGEGSTAIQLVHEYLSEVPARPH